MNRKKTVLGILLLSFGAIGIFSLGTMEGTLPSEVKEVLEGQFSPLQVKLLVLVNPIILLVLSVLAGTILYEKVNLHAPIFEKVTGLREAMPRVWDILRGGLMGGVVAGVFIVLISALFEILVPVGFRELGEGNQTPILVRILYGGITEEILMRYGLMTLIVWISLKVFKSIHISYWVGILVSAILFAFGHFPVVFQAVDNPSILLLTYILAGNSVGGIVFGWLYWKKGLESAMLAHIFAHLVMLTGDFIIQ